MYTRFTLPVLRAFLPSDGHFHGRATTRHGTIFHSATFPTSGALMHNDGLSHLISRVLNVVGG